MRLTLDLGLEEFQRTGLREIARRFDEMHTQLFTFALDAPHELVNLRAIVQGRETTATLERLPEGGPDPSEALVGKTQIFVDGAEHHTAIYDRVRLKSGNRITGPAIVTQMDTTTLVLPDHVAEVDSIGTLLIRPVA
jgi:N-methylhydantoinase A